MYCTSDELLCLTAQWSESGLAAYDLEALCNPVVNDSATEEAMKGEDVCVPCCSLKTVPMEGAC